MMDRVLATVARRLEAMASGLHDWLVARLERDGVAMVDGRFVPVGNDGLTDSERHELAAQFHARAGAKPLATDAHREHRAAIMDKLRGESRPFAHL